MAWNLRRRICCLGWILPPIRNSWLITIIGLYIALNRTPNLNCYWVGAVPNVQNILFRVLIYRI